MEEQSTEKKCLRHKMNYSTNRRKKRFYINHKEKKEVGEKVFSSG